MSSSSSRGRQCTASPFSDTPTPVHYFQATAAVDMGTQVIRAQLSGVIGRRRRAAPAYGGFPAACAAPLAVSQIAVGVSAAAGGNPRVNRRTSPRQARTCAFSSRSRSSFQKVQCPTTLRRLYDPNCRAVRRPTAPPSRRGLTLRRPDGQGSLRLPAERAPDVETKFEWKKS